ncbi:Zinc knuckle [Carpediemonas membranifera]|uniref:Zinc knuckle n=1 Tax=Carpediemonas membranifera TaxID=201153 RepID=A0A8J6B104_9EUKA|nr:Zinc knuckle [Carpediemonas membranifera]|eukprot:KAG9390707.1 Zinc knuckle [Carpediemonas membranifera]
MRKASIINHLMKQQAESASIRQEMNFTARDAAVLLALIILYPYFFVDTGGNVVYQHALKDYPLYTNDTTIPVHSFTPQIHTVNRVLKTRDLYINVTASTPLSGANVVIPSTRAVELLPLTPILMYSADTSGSSYMNAYTSHNAEEMTDVLETIPEIWRSHLATIVSENRAILPVDVKGDLAAFTMGKAAGLTNTGNVPTTHFAVLTDDLELALSDPIVALKDTHSIMWAADVSSFLFCANRGFTSQEEICPFQSMEHTHVALTSDSILVAVTGRTAKAPEAKTIFIHRLQTNKTAAPPAPMERWARPVSVNYDHATSGPMTLVFGQTPKPYLLLQRYLTSKGVEAQRSPHSDRHALQVARLQHAETLGEDASVLTVPQDRWGPADTVVYRGEDTITFVDLDTGSVLACFVVSPSVTLFSGRLGGVTAFYQTVEKDVYQKSMLHGHAVAVDQDGARLMWSVPLHSTGEVVNYQYVTQPAPTPDPAQTIPQIIGNHVAFLSWDGIRTYKADRSARPSWTWLTTPSKGAEMSVHSTGSDPVLAWTDEAHIRMLGRKGDLQLETHLPAGSNRRVSVGLLDGADSVTVFTDIDGRTMMDVWVRVPGSKLATAAKGLVLGVAAVGVVFGLRISTKAKLRRG